MPDRQMDMLEPYDYSDIEGFAMPYLSGYLSERYNYTSDEIESRVKERADDYITDMAEELCRESLKVYQLLEIM